MDEIGRQEAPTMNTRSSEMPFSYVRFTGSRMKIVCDESKILNDVLSNVEGLADSAISFFSGLFPYEAPHSVWGEALELPWFGKYHAASYYDGCFTYNWVALEPDLTAAARKILAGRPLLERGPDIAENYWRNADDEFHTVQLLAVEALLMIEGMISSVASGCFASALAWQFAAFANVSEATVRSMDMLYRSTGSLAIH